MTVYIEAVVIDNFFVTVLAALLSYRFLSLSVSKLRVIGASAVGTAVAVFYPLMNVHAAVLVFLKFALGAVLSFILFYNKCNILKGGGVFLLITFLFGGALFAVGLLIYADAQKALTLPVSKIPIGLFICAALVLFFVFRKVVSFAKKIKDSRAFIADTEITVFSKTVKTKGFLDTGNRLYDTATGLPIVVLSAKAALGILDGDKLSTILGGHGDQIADGAHYMEFSTVGGKNGKILVLKPDEMRLYFGQTEHRIKDVMIGISFSAFKDCTEYDVILHPAVI